MCAAVSDLQQMIGGMAPALNAGVYAYVCVPHGTDTAGTHAMASVHEAEGLTLVLPEAQAQARGWPVLLRCAWITLHVHSDLNAYGLTAAFAKTLSDAQISCNVLAGAYHDHIFVPAEQAEAAIAALRRLQDSVRQ